MGNAIGRAAAIDFSIQWVSFLLAAYLRTEKFYDAVGSLTYIILTAYSLIRGGKFFPRQVIQSGLVVTWAMRLGSFLLFRVLKAGQDSRFSKIRGNPKMFFLYWSVQGLWIFLMLLPTLILNAKQEDTALCSRDYIGWAIWIAGMLIEAIADYQKFTYRSNPANADKWIDHGLWGIVRHPNYLGEILLWFGHFIAASSTFSGFDYVGIISPLFITFLLTKVSGIPILERQNMKKWKGNPQYLQYVQKTPRLLPFLY